MTVENFCTMREAFFTFLARLRISSAVSLSDWRVRTLLISGTLFCGTGAKIFQCVLQYSRWTSLELGGFQHIFQPNTTTYWRNLLILQSIDLGTFVVWTISRKEYFVAFRHFIDTFASRSFVYLSVYTWRHPDLLHIHLRAIEVSYEEILDN